MRRSVERGFTLVEIMIVVAIIALLAAIAIPNVLRGRTTANESAAIGNLHAVITSLEMYRSVNTRYPQAAATDWQVEMYTTPNPDFGPPSFNNTMAGGTTAATGMVQGFRYTYTGVAGGATYTVLAVPDSGATGTRAFRADESGLLLHCTPATNATTLANLATELTIDQAPNICNGSPLT
jgi:prepilin-type N-terminal cleavage/methylation domain-containing protein